MRQPSIPDVDFAFSRVRLAEVTLHVAFAGPEEGEPVVLLHGFPEFWWGWRRQIPGLVAAGYRVVVPDQRGYNLSDKPRGASAYGARRLAGDVAALIAATCDGRAHLVGHDWGGVIAWAVGALHPERLMSLSVLNAPSLSVTGGYARRHPSQALKSSYVAAFQAPVLPEIALSARGYRALRRALVGSSRRGTFDRADLAIYADAWAQPGALTAMLNWYRGLVRAPARLEGMRVPVRTQVLWGARDRFLEVGLARESVALCDHGRLDVFDDATHWIHLEEPEAVTQRLVAFFKAG